MRFLNRATRRSVSSRSWLRPRSRTVPFPNGFGSAPATPLGTNAPTTTNLCRSIFPTTPRFLDTLDEQADYEMLTGSLEQVQRQAEALAQDPPRPLDAFTLPSSFDPERNKTRFSPTAAATSHLGSADLPLSQPHRWLPSSTCLLDGPPLRGIETMP